MRNIETLPLVLFGTALFIYALFTFVKVSFYKSVEAICIAVEPRTSYSGGESSLSYVGTYKYVFCGEEIIAKSNSPISAKGLHVGQRYVLLVNPKHHNVFVEKSEVKYYMFFLLVGLVFIFFAPTLF